MANNLTKPRQMTLAEIIRGITPIRQTSRVSIPTLLPYDPTAGMSEAEKFWAGAGGGLTSIGRVFQNRMGMLSDDELRAAVWRDSPLFQTEAGGWGRFFGENAALLPLSVLLGGRGGLLPGVSRDGLTQSAFSRNPLREY